jgi:tripartite-type tricarboxylate transporter receptor subunit TctC
MTATRARLWWLVWIAILFGAASSLPAQAEEYPSRPITLVLPLGAGGAMDIVARGTLGPRLAERLGQPVVIENRTGGGTVIAANAVAKAAPDGYTLLFAPSGTFTTNVAVFKQLPYDPTRDFVPIALTSKVAFVLVVNPSLPVQSMAELIAYAKANPGKLSFASTGTGQAPHLAGEMLKSMAGIEMTHVPYKGSPPALNDVIAGHVQLTFTDPAISPPLIKDAKVRALGVSSLTRVDVLPDVPPIAQTLPGFEAVSWHLVAAPADTPKAVVDRLHAELAAVLALPEVRRQMINIGLIPVDTPSVTELRRFVSDEIVRWGKLVEQAGIAGSE